MRLRKQLLTKNDCYKAGRTIQVQGVMVHSTGANNPWVSRYVPGDAEIGYNTGGNHWNQTNAEWKKKYGKALDKCVHAFVGKFADGEVGTVQTLPWTMKGWHSGPGSKQLSANSTHIAFEICEDGLNDPVYFQKVYQEAVELTAFLCKEYGLDPLAGGVVICHQDGYRLGVASNHGDVYNWFPKFGKTMDDFRADVVRSMSGESEEDNEMVTYKTLDDVPDYYQDAVRKAVDAGALNGTGNGELNVSEDLCRTLTVLDRLGKLS